MKRTAKGRGVLNFLELSVSDKVLALIPYGKKDEAVEKYLAMITRNGIIKKIELSAFKSVRRNGLIVIKLQAGDALVSARILNKSDELILITREGQSVRFKEADVRPMGRSAAGVKGIKLKGGDKVVAMEIAQADNHLLVLTEKGYGKRTKISQYRLQKRGGSGIKTARLTDKTGPIVFAKVVGREYGDLIVISKKGQIIRSGLKSVSVLGRAASGVKVMKLDAGDKVASAICL